MRRWSENPTVVGINTVAALLAVAQFVLYLFGVVVAPNVSIAPRINIRLGDGTVMVLFLVVEAAILYVVWPLGAALRRARVPLPFIAAVTITLPCYATQVNFDFFWSSTLGEFDLTRWPFVVGIVLVGVAAFFVAFAAVETERAI